MRSFGALALGALFALGTVYVLFSDLTSPSQITVDHVMTLLVLIGTVASGHMVTHQRRPLPVLGLAVLFGAGTFYCVTTSAARNAEGTVAKGQAVQSTNEQRQKLEADLATAREDLRRAKASAESECRSGEGARCRSTVKLRDQADSHYWILSARLAEAQPRQIENAGLKHAARVFAALPLVQAAPDAIERALLLFGPFVKALFLEIATIVFLGIGLARDRRAFAGSQITVVDAQYTEVQPKEIIVMAKKQKPKQLPPPAPSRSFPDDAPITVLVDENPKRGKCRARFALYRRAKTVGDYLDRCAKLEGKARGHYLADLRWDTERSLVRVG